MFGYVYGSLHPYIAEMPVFIKDSGNILFSSFMCIAYLFSLQYDCIRLVSNLGNSKKILIFFVELEGWVCYHGIYNMRLDNCGCSTIFNHKNTIYKLYKPISIERMAYIYGKKKCLENI